MRIVSQKEMFIKSLSTLFYSWGSDAPDEVFWGNKKFIVVLMICLVCLGYIIHQYKSPPTFQRSWKNAKDNPPKEGGRYWCLIEEQNDLGKSHFQWNCSYHEIEKRWSDNSKNYNVIYWTELAPMPKL